MHIAYVLSINAYTHMYIAIIRIKHIYLYLYIFVYAYVLQIKDHSGACEMIAFEPKTSIYLSIYNV